MEKIIKTIKIIKEVFNEAPKRLQGFFVGIIYMFAVQFVASLIQQININLNWMYKVTIPALFLIFIIVKLVKILKWCEK